MEDLQAIEKEIEIGERFYLRERLQRRDQVREGEERERGKPETNAKYGEREMVVTVGNK